ncbi:MAG TPA: hypothetical protein VLG67_00390, partial [Candidatus Saccharimonadales bacterium]|nr:hypothetical protein [Candidatus Saccharimonadales bacterium]
MSNEFVKFLKSKVCKVNKTNSKKSFELMKSAASKVYKVESPKFIKSKAFRVLLAFSFLLLT